MFQSRKNLSKKNSEGRDFMPSGFIPVVCIVGPTASGKTDLAVDLALEFEGEIISADSMQVYKEFEISTAKPGADQIKAVPHHLIDFLSVSEEFSVARFKVLADKFIEDIHSCGKLSFLVGGTGLYIDSLLKNINFEDFSNVNDKEAEAFQGLSNEKLAEILEKVDPVSAEKIHLNDTKRLIRAIEFFYAAGYPISKQTNQSKKAQPLYKVCKIGLNFKDRDILYDRINKRVDKMFEKGIVEEVRKLSRMHLSKTAQAAIGYKEIIPFLEGKCKLEEARENLKKVTRNYAKRQLTWFRRDKEINWIYPDEHDNFFKVTDTARDIIKNFDW